MKKILSIALVVILCFTLVLTGCSSKSNESSSPVVNEADKKVLNVYNWGEYIEPALLTEFETKTGIKVNYTNYATNEEMYAKIKAGGASYDVIFPSDYMVSRMIKEGMLEKIDASKLENYKKIDQKFLKNVFDPTSEYSVPYMWGTVGIIYNTKMVTEDVDSWDILWNKKYAGKILMFDNPRDAMGVALKKLGYSLNTTDKTQLDQAYSLLVEQKPLVQAYVMDQVFDKMESGEAALAVYYAGDALTMMENNPDLAFALPKEGSNIFIDAMCIPKGAKNKEGALKFIDFMTSTDASLKNIEVTGYSTPQKEAYSKLDEDVKNDGISYPDDKSTAKCESFTTLPDDILAYYDTLWAKLKA